MFFASSGASRARGVGALGPHHAAAERRGLSGTERDGDEGSLERGVVDVGGDPLAGGVHVDGARVRAAVGGDGAGADEGVDDGVELGGHGRDGDVGLHAVGVGVGAELQHLAALVARAPLVGDGGVRVAGERAGSTRVQGGADPNHDAVVRRRVEHPFHQAQARGASRERRRRPTRRRPTRRGSARAGAGSCPRGAHRDHTPRRDDSPLYPRGFPSRRCRDDPARLREVSYDETEPGRNPRPRGSGARAGVRSKENVVGKMDAHPVRSTSDSRRKQPPPKPVCTPHF